MPQLVDSLHARMMATHGQATGFAFHRDCPGYVAGQLPPLIDKKITKVVGRDVQLVPITKRERDYFKHPDLDRNFDMFFVDLDPDEAFEVEHVLNTSEIDQHFGDLAVLLSFD